MYHLVFASKAPFGDKLWNDIAKKLPGPQTSLFRD